MSIQRKFLLAISTVIALLALIIAIVTVFTTSSSISSQIQDQKEETGDRLINILQVTDTLMLERVKSSMALLKQRGAQLGTPKQSGMVSVKNTQARQLLLGNETQANNFELVDGLTSVMGGTATLFSRTGEDYIRVSTNVIKNGERAIGTKLAPNGKAIKQIQQNKAYYGAVDILGSPYLTGYEPMFDASNNVIGIWYVGYSADLKVLEDAIKESHVLEDGFVALRDGKDNIRMHSTHVNDEEVNRALSNNDDWIVTVIPFSEWGYDVILAASTDEKAALIGGAVFTVILKIVLASAGVLITIWLLVKNIVGQPLDEFIEVVNNLSSGEGDLTFRFQASRSDEFGVMARAFNQLLGQLQETLQNVDEATEGMLAKSEALNLTASESSKSVDLLSKETKNINHSISLLQQNADTVSANIRSSSEAAQAADSDTRNSVSVLSQTISDIEAQASDVDASVQVITELAQASEEISGVMEVIRTIAEQTNLLALNAAIEAARAGEQGRGFAVVADEVRSLASRTQSSTEEIRIMIERLQQGSRVASEKMQHNKDTAFKTVEVTKHAGESLKQALDAVARITLLNKEATSMADGQKDVANSVNNGLGSIQKVGEANRDYAHDVAQNCEELVAQIKRMQMQLRRYHF
ncbi:methyl-accepting chemotaxis protein [Alteromonas sp. S167]|uniref:methyl-accepting chemotaxis protein n=1 Tax=Alteromonas sp. S167 TaxID=3117402 RepID=UPI002FE235C1